MELVMGKIHCCAV